MKENYFTQNFLQKWEKKFKEKKKEFLLEKSALFLIDLQNYFITHEGSAYVPSSSHILSGLINLAKFYKENNLPIVITRHIDSPKKHPQMFSWWGEVLRKEDPQSEIIKELKEFLEYSIYIEKNYYDSFFRTGLSQILKGKNVKSILIGGVLTNLCCETTARSGFLNNFEVFFLFDGTATYKKEYHEGTILNISYGFGTIYFVKEILNQF